MRTTQVDLFGKPVRNKMDKKQKINTFWRLWRKRKKDYFITRPFCLLCGMKAETLHHTDDKITILKMTMLEYIYSKNVVGLCHLCHHFFVHAQKKDWKRGCCFCGYAVRERKNDFICNTCKKTQMGKQLIYRPDILGQIQAKNTMKILQSKLKTKEYQQWYTRMKDRDLIVEAGEGDRIVVFTTVPPNLHLYDSFLENNLLVFYCF